MEEFNNHHAQVSKAEIDAALKNNTENITKTSFPQQPHENSEAIHLNISNVKNYFGYILVGGIVLSAAIAILAIFLGGFNSYIYNALSSVFWMVVHAIIALAFVSIDTKSSPVWKRILVNTMFVIVIASFFTSFLAIWEIISSTVTWHLYISYWYGFITATFIALVLKQDDLADTATSTAIKSTIGFALLEYLYSLFWIFSDNPSLLGQLYWKFFATFSILLGTSAILAVVFKKLYKDKHPELFIKRESYNIGSRQSHLGRNIIIVILGIIFLPLILNIIGYILRSIFFYY